MADKLTTRIERLAPGELALLDLNARYMTHEQFARLVDNVRRDGCLTSVPFAHWDAERARYVVLSGNHRVKAAREAELEAIDVMVTDEPLEKARRIALQLSHNSIAGQDDPAVLKELWEEIDDVDWREFAGLDDRTLKLLDEIKPGALSEAYLDFQTMTFMFLPTEVTRLKAAFEDARTITSGADAVFLAGLAQYEAFADALDMAGRSSSISNQATAIGVLLEVFYANLTRLRDYWRAERENQAWVPVPSVTGWEMPQAAARVVAQAIDRMTAQEQISAPWQALELWAADYLAAPEESVNTP